MPFIPHTEDDTAAMLAALNVDSIETLFDEIPPALRCQGLDAIPDGINEMNLLNLAKQFTNRIDNKVCFIGAGSYDHHIPAAVWDIASRGEFLTSYTPYQAEASQGTLQLLYEFQTMISSLTAMDVANASLYDGASALAEAVLMAVRIKQPEDGAKVLVAGSLHPFYLETVQTIIKNQRIEIVSIGFDAHTGLIDSEALERCVTDNVVALVVMQPNFFGCLEEVDSLCNWAHSRDMLCIASVNPIALALLKPPGEWGNQGADIVCGEGQPLGVPMASGGPYFGFLSTRMTYVRQLPGRLIGRTIDRTGKPGFSLTLQAREQHIRRGKATSNICTNQGLLVTAATIHMSLLGAAGLKAVALDCHHNTTHLQKLLTDIRGVTTVFSSPFFHEIVLQFDKPIAEVVLALEDAGIMGGFPLEPYFPMLKNSLLICATEMRTTDQINHYAATLQRIMGED